jgi:hypothetical protein
MKTTLCHISVQLDCGSSKLGFTPSLLAYYPKIFLVYPNSHGFIYHFLLKITTLIIHICGVFGTYMYVYVFGTYMYACIYHIYNV